MNSELINGNDISLSALVDIMEQEYRRATASTLDLEDCTMEYSRYTVSDPEDTRPTTVGDCLQGLMEKTANGMPKTCWSDSTFDLDRCSVDYSGCDRLHQKGRVSTRAGSRFTVGDFHRSPRHL